MCMKIRPLHDHVIVKAVTEEEVTKSGIVLPDTVDKEKPEQGEVIAVGPGKLLENGQRAQMSVKAGDKVVFKKYSPDEMKVDDQEYLVISESDIMGVLE
jgi:chaperonin GroES